jgi:hypothetical protein
MKLSTIHCAVIAALAAIYGWRIYDSAKQQGGAK